jgi:hypothetical protein
MSDVRETSIQAYYEIAASGLLAKRRFEAYQYLFDLGGTASAGEIDRYYVDKLNPGSYYKGLAKRLSELRDWGVIDEVGIKHDPVTNHDVILWSVNGKLPKKPQQQKSTGTLRKEYLNGLVNQLASFHQRVDLFYKDEVQELLNLAKMAANTKG